MPKGSPKSQTIATDKYQKKAGYVSKSFKLKKDVVEVYKDACEKAGVTQAGQLTKLMLAFVEQQKEKESEK